MGIVKTATGLATVLLLLGTGGMIAGASPLQSSPGPVSLLYAGWYGNTIPTPAFIRANRAFLETQPFQGIIAYLRDDASGVNVTTGVLSTNPLSASVLAGVLSPLRGLPFTRLVDNFGLVQGSNPPDFFDDWSVTVQNFANLAAALRDAGLRGICFDNEQYAMPWGNYPSGVKYPGHSLAEYQAQARARGLQVMQAMVAQFPQIAVITLHGPYVSEMTAPESLKFPQWQSQNELLGPFAAGFVEGAGASGLAVDGGELYDLRSAADFLEAYNWRKYTMASSTVNCPFLPAALRTSWSSHSSIGFGVYDQPFGAAAMSPAILKTTLARALRQTDRYAWFYTEGGSFLLPASQGGAGASWVDAVAGAVAEARSTAPIAEPTVAAEASSSGGGSGGGCGLLGLEAVFGIGAGLLSRRSRARAPR